MNQNNKASCKTRFQTYFIRVYTKLAKEIQVKEQRKTKQKRIIFTEINFKNTPAIQSVLQNKKPYPIPV